MTKQEQKQINQLVLDKLEQFTNSSLKGLSVRRLRDCNAFVYEYLDDKTGAVLYALQSYNTIIAIIDGNTVYDFLRLVYGYTATSAKHIAKFTHDYIDSWYDETIVYRYYPIEG